MLYVLLILGQLQGEVSYPSTPDLAVGAVIVDKPGGWLVFKQAPFAPARFTSINNGAGVIFEGEPGAYIIFYFPPGQTIPQPEVTVKTLGGASVPLPNQAASRVTYVYEKSNNPVPRPVAVALRALNENDDGLSASEFEQDSVNSANKTPDQFVAALAAAKKAGLPALVVESETGVLRVVQNPTTEEDVYRACRPETN